ncbi:Uncharacterised protein [Sarcina ventriculi]|uniref:Uncharacterized protein n=1 Tax=Sarcina ventriculi TaxID=1267 RepID=A0ABM9UNX5_SARVE|nr:Uncharacterised protein [Sarcina ventriculi]
MCEPSDYIRRYVFEELENYIFKELVKKCNESIEYNDKHEDEIDYI